VSNDETSFLAVGMDDKAAPVMITQTKKTAIDKSKFTAVSGKMLKSPDGKKIVYLEQKQLTTQEMEEVSTGKSKLSYNVLRPDGTGFLLTDYSNLGKYRLTNTGAIINVNESTGEVYADNKKLGKFNLPSGGEVETDAIMIGGSNNNITYYDGSTGSLIYLDGSVKKMGIMFPSVITQNGKTYMSWFRKCKNDIYIGKFSY
jgi:hypothetical protein